MYLAPTDKSAGTIGGDNIGEEVGEERNDNGTENELTELVNIIPMQHD